MSTGERRTSSLHPVCPRDALGPQPGLLRTPGGGAEVGGVGCLSRRPLVRFGDMVVRGVVKLGTATAAAAAGATAAAVASDPHGVTAQLVRLKLEQALGAAQQSSVRTAGQLQQTLPQSTVVHVNAGGGASWRTLALVGGASAVILTWMRCKGYTWEDIAYVTQHAFRESVATLAEGLEATAGAIEATREQLRAKIGEVEQQLAEATDGLHQHVEEQIGAARADIADVREALKATDEVLQQVYDDMATESQVEELRVMLGDGQRTAEQTKNVVDRMRGDLGHVVTDIAALRQLVAAQYAEQQRWVAMQLENAVSSKLRDPQEPKIVEMQSSPSSPPVEPAQTTGGAQSAYKTVYTTATATNTGGVAASLLYTTGSALAVVANNARPRGLGLGAMGRTELAHRQAVI